MNKLAKWTLIGFCGLSAFGFVVSALVNSTVGDNGTKPIETKLSVNKEKKFDVVKEYTGAFKFLPTENKYKAYTTKDGKTLFNLDEDPLEGTDGNMYGFMLEAIPLIYENDAGDYLGPQLQLYKLPNGTNALAIITEKYRYLALHVRMSDTDRRVGAIVFWREEI